MSLVAGGETIEGENVESPKTYFLNGALCQEKDVQAPRRNVAKLLGTSENGTARRLLLFDGQSRLCLGFVSIVVGRDSSDLFRFAPLQSDLGQEVLLSHGVPKDIDSVVLLRDGEVYTHSDAALEASSPLHPTTHGFRGCTQGAGLGVAAGDPGSLRSFHSVQGSSKNKQGMIRLLKSLLSSFSEPDFQKECCTARAEPPRARAVWAYQEVERLKKSAGKDLADQGFYQLPGRAELAFAIQEQLLPCFGAWASKSGVTDMIGQCAAYLEDPEVAQLFDSVNAKLGMSPSACAKFREKAKLMLP
eukprot:g10924.t1